MHVPEVPAPSSPVGPGGQAPPVGSPEPQVDLAFGVSWLGAVPQLVYHVLDAALVVCHGGVGVVQGPGQRRSICGGPCRAPSPALRCLALVLRFRDQDHGKGEDAEEKLRRKEGGVRLPRPQGWHGRGALPPPVGHRAMAGPH